VSRNPHDFFTGPRIDTGTTERMAGVSTLETEGATWRGWTLGAVCVVLVCLFIPYLDFVIAPPVLTNSRFPAASLVFLFLLVLALNAGLSLFRSAFGLTRQDLVLVFCMTMLVNAIPGCGFWSFWAPTMIGGQYFATPENNWESVLRHMPDSWAPHDTLDSRPIEHFYTGLPNLSPDFVGRLQQVPWRPWLGPYAVWCVALLFLFGVMFAVSGILRKQWSENERLPFPLAQLPEELVSGVGTSNPRPFFRDRMAWWGIGLVFALYSMNNLSLYRPEVPQLALTNGLDQYLTELPWSVFRPFPAFIFISVVGLSYLVSLEVSFSVWFFWIVMKAATFVFYQAGIAQDGWFFNDTQSSGYRSVFRAQGTGALIAMVLLGFWMARRQLKESAKQALGLMPGDPAESGFSPRTLWTVLLICLTGSVGWLVFYGVGIGPSLFVVATLVISLVGLARIFCESGIFYVQIYEFPSLLLQKVATPGALGTATYVKLSLWDRVMVADWYRVAFMPVIMNSLHLATRTGLRRRSVMLGMAGAVALALTVSFGSFLYTVYTQPGGANTMAWYFNHFPRWEYGLLTPKVQQMDSYEQRVAVSAEPLPEADRPEVARRDWIFLASGLLGAGFMALSAWLRSFLFWFPHPFGYMMWMCSHPHYNTWFSFLLGWGIKKAILRFGGNRTYLRARRFFIGLVIGEAFGVLFWKVVAASTGNLSSFGMLPG